MSHSTAHYWAFILETEYNAGAITQNHYPVNLIVESASETQYRSLEWVGDLLPELSTWHVFSDHIIAAAFLEKN